MGHAAFIDHIVACAQARHARKYGSSITEVRYVHGAGYGMYASRDISVGETVIKYEERPHVIVTKGFIKRTFGPEAVPGPSPVDTAHAHAGHHGKANGQHANGQHANGHAEANGTAAAANSAASANGAATTNGAAGGLQTAAWLEGVQGPSEADDEKLSQKARWFKAYAYPVSDETWVTWSENPDDWLPLNHGCDPNTWLEGLNLVACKPIKKGDHVSAYVFRVLFSFFSHLHFGG